MIKYIAEIRHNTTIVCYLTLHTPINANVALNRVMV